MMEWGGISPLKSKESIAEFERHIGYVFPEDFRKCVMENNGGYPLKKDIFDTDETKECCINRLFTFNREEKGNIWVMSEWDVDNEEDQEVADAYVAFASDGFGNSICFDRNDGSVWFVDHETMYDEFIADSFTEFLDKLYELGSPD